MSTRAQVAHKGALSNALRWLNTSITNTVEAVDVT